MGHDIRISVDTLRGDGIPPAPTSPYDEYYYQGNDQSGDRIALWFYARVAHRLAAPGASVLDFGSGVGHFSRRLAQRFDSTAYDLSPYAREQTKKTSPSSHIVDDTAAIASASLDLVCSLHVLEHVPDPAATFREFARLLRPNGRLLYVVPNPQGWGHRIKQQKWFAYRDPTHCSVLSKAAWLAATRDGGFSIERVAADGLWDAPYVARVPKVIQRPFFGALAGLQVVLGRVFLPADWGECLVVFARRQN